MRDGHAKSQNESSNSNVYENKYPILSRILDIGSALSYDPVYRDSPRSKHTDMKEKKKRSFESVENGIAGTQVLALQHKDRQLPTPAVISPTDKMDVPASDVCQQSVPNGGANGENASKEPVHKKNANKDDKKIADSLNSNVGHCILEYASTQHTRTKKESRRKNPNVWKREDQDE